MANPILTTAVVLGGILAATALGGSSRPPQTLRDRYGLPSIDAIEPARTAVIVVDAQREFLDGELRLGGAGTAAVDAGAALLDWAREHGVGVVHVRQEGKPGAPLFARGTAGVDAIDALAERDGEPVVTKATGGGFTGTDLEAQLRRRGVDTVIVAGFMTHHAVDMTVRDAGARGLRVIVATDATATRDLPAPDDGPPLRAADVQRAALAILADRYAELRRVDEIAALPLR